MKVKLNSILYNRSLVDGPGVRTVIYFQGCDMHCKGCHNKATWDISKGIEYDTKDLAYELKANCVNKKITISGGEPLLQLDALIELLDLLSDFNICLYTGREIESVPTFILDKINYLKTGPFVQELTTTTAPYVGSSNQTFRRIK